MMQSAPPIRKARATSQASLGAMKTTGMVPPWDILSMKLWSVSSSVISSRARSGGSFPDTEEGSRLAAGDDLVAGFPQGFLHGHADAGILGYGDDGGVFPAFSFLCVLAPADRVCCPLVLVPTSALHHPPDRLPEVLPEVLPDGLSAPGPGVSSRRCLVSGFARRPGPDRRPSRQCPPSRRCGRWLLSSLAGCTVDVHLCRDVVVVLVEGRVGRKTAVGRAGHGRAWARRTCWRSSERM